ncbi:hypothetical protein OXX80_006385 [Metschnikowia pulcherrima]
MNGAPDIVNSHLMIKSKSMNLVMGQIIGANLISFTVIVGSISIMRPFTMVHTHNLLSGYCFVCAMVLMLSYVLMDGKITIAECFFLTLLYPLHIGLSSLDKSPEQVSPDLERCLSKDLVTEATCLLTHQTSRDEPLEAHSPSPLESFVNITITTVDWILFSLLPVSSSTLTREGTDPGSLKFQIRSKFFFQLWLITVSTALLNESIFGLPWTILLYAIPAIFCGVKILTQLARPQVLDLILDAACMASSLALITILTKIVICLLKNFGVMWQISEYIMGLLVFSLASCLNDILINTSLALTHSPALGIKACMSSCCLLISIAVGFNGFWELSKTALRKGELSLSLALPVTLTWELYVSLIALNLTVMFAVAYITINKWTLDRNLGFGLIGIWLVATGACIAIELDKSI